MADSLKPIKLFTHVTGPNPWKVAILLEELGLPYESQFMELTNLKKPEFEQYNPNGRVPAIIDPNTGITLWESGAIIQYLVENYDKEQKLSFSSTPEKYFANQWLMFQVSGQGPYFGQGAWFGNFHAEDVPSAKKRYQEEIVRVTKVLDGWLKNHTYLVGDKCCYADLSFVTWYWLLEFITKTPSFEEQLKKDYPNWKRWIEALEARPAVKKVYEARNAKIAASH